MKIVHTDYWIKKRFLKRKDITDDLIEYALQYSMIIKDRNYEERFNAIHRIPPNGRTLKVVYEWVEKGKIKIITAYWLD